MNPYLNKLKSPPPMMMSRIDLLLACYDGAIDRIDRAQQLLDFNETEALGLLIKAQLIVCELSAGVRLDIDPEMGTNYLRLYEFIANALKDHTHQSLTAASKLLRNLREGFASIRDEANAMEKRGELPSADRLMTLCEMA